MWKWGPNNLFSFKYDKFGIFCTWLRSCTLKPVCTNIFAACCSNNICKCFTIVLLVLISLFIIIHNNYPEKKSGSNSYYQSFRYLKFGNLDKNYDRPTTVRKNFKYTLNIKMIIFDCNVNHWYFAATLDRNYIKSISAIIVVYGLNFELFHGLENSVRITIKFNLILADCTDFVLSITRTFIGRKGYLFFFFFSSLIDRGSIKLRRHDIVYVFRI